MGFGSIPRVLADLTAINREFLRSSEARAAFRQYARVGSTASLLDRAEFRRTPEAARAFAGLTPTSLALAGVRSSGDNPPQLNLVVGAIQPGGLFAGVKTALGAASGLATRLHLPLRIVLLEQSAARHVSAMAQWAANSIPNPVTVVPRNALGDVAFGTRDVWLATHSRTAHALDVARASDVIDARRVAYLIQDYEPGFSAWSTESVVAASTYHAGFLPLVNSVPLAAFLRRQEGDVVDDALVFAPAFDDTELREAAARRASSPRLRVLFYARPTKQRNLFELGVSALRATAATAGEGVEFVSAGEPHAKVALGARHILRPLGQLPRENYFAELSRSPVVLALQQSPHPGHSAFDAAISGALCVTNDFDGAREVLHPRLIAASPEVRSVSAALVEAIERTRIEGSGSYLPVAAGLLGAPLASVLDTAAERLAARGD